MKIAVMADIHSNIEAFKTCYEEAEKQGVTEYIFLGDYLGDMAIHRKHYVCCMKFRRSILARLFVETKRNIGSITGKIPMKYGQQVQRLPVC